MSSLALSLSKTKRVPVCRTVTVSTGIRGLKVVCRKTCHVVTHNFRNNKVIERKETRVLISSIVEVEVLASLLRRRGLTTLELAHLYCQGALAVHYSGVFQEHHKHTCYGPCVLRS